MSKETKVIPNWLFLRYTYIWIRFKEQQFYSSDVKKQFKRTTNTCLKALTEAGWLISFKEEGKTMFRARPTKEILEDLYAFEYIFQS
ncbi:hypothetical protein DRN76_03050 [Methanosarcinales archaeon]|nr:MAG: hypothetical protein DRN76_03050 [Methanosarcinales archaeon]